MSNADTMKAALKLVLTLAALLGIIWLWGRIGWPAISANLGLIGGLFILLVLLFLFAELAFTAGWWVLIGPRARRIGFWRTLGVYLAGCSVNYFIPPGNLSGEPLKAHLLSRLIGFRRSITSITVHKHAEITALVLFLSGCLTVAMTQFALPSGLRNLILSLIVGMWIFVALVSQILKRRAFETLRRGLARIGIRSEQIKPHWQATASLDRWLARFYKTRMRAFYWSTLLCLLGWCGGLLETYLVLRWLSAKPSLGTAVAVESLALALNSLIFFIPGRVGSAEAVRVLVFSVLGLPAAEGVAYSIVRRGREVVWAILGLLILLAMKTRMGGAPKRLLVPVQERAGLPAPSPKVGIPEA
ncbi:MAG: flippase-like domain-containing protein [candidate division NC10 bacterium]|nr:flippase-like domain-containing protein [candidate division NC10 bacterium]